MQYTKGPLSYAAQLQQLQQRGLHVADPARAIYYLERVGYYRLMGYLFPFRLPGSDNYKPGASFEQAVELYEFDQVLRSLVMEAICHIEVAVRTAVTYQMAHSYGAFGYSNPINVAYDPGWHASWIRTVQDDVGRSRETFIAHYKANYTQPAHPQVPIWMASEVMSFGSLSKLVQAMHPADKKAIAGIFGIAAPVFASWVHTIAALRNIAAHHGRMWNRVLGVVPMRPKSGAWQHMAGSYPVDRMYFALLVIKALLASCATDADDWRDSVTNHIGLLLVDQGHRQSMGAPANWDQHPLWI
ncbi:Abi family protein [Luteibacter sp. 9133]|uniref:Abi family protein n=1 Tax=Luteibacter sp. 9133 TaxID=1500891 RepID=UPI0005BA3EA5|nr:Abi family protein [Luteibacter sp. 9133]